VCDLLWISSTVGPMQLFRVANKFEAIDNVRLENADAAEKSSKKNH
jgi:hypothetical protein